MRELKFRAWDTEMQMICFPKAHYIINGSVATPSQKAEAWGNQPIGEIYNPEENEHHTVFVEDERFVLMQYTGLKDKNGKEIYEGDIVIKFGIDDAKYEVKYGEQLVGHDWLGVGFYTFNKSEQCNIFGGNYIKVIGNIYENPDLLAQQKN